VVGHGHPAVAQSLVAAERVGVVAAHVTALAVARVREYAVKFDNHAVVRVQHVEVLQRHPPDHARLPVAAWQPVPAFHVPGVAKLEWRVDAGPDIGDSVSDVTSPPGPAARLQSDEYAVRSGQPTLTRPNRPRNRVLGRPRQVSEVKSGLLKLGLRRQPRRVPGLLDARGKMEHEPRNSRRGRLPRDCQVDRARGGIGEPPEFGGGVVAEDRVLAHPEDGTPQLGLAGNRAAERGEHSPVQPLPASGIEARGDQARRQAGVHGLFASQRPVLPVDYINNW
jgi:hypothetical protein